MSLWAASPAPLKWTSLDISGSRAGWEQSIWANSLLIKSLNVFTQFFLIYPVLTAQRWWSPVNSNTFLCTDMCIGRYSITEASTVPNRFASTSVIHANIYVGLRIHLQKRNTGYRTLNDSLHLLLVDIFSLQMVWLLHLPRVEVPHKSVQIFLLMSARTQIGPCSQSCYRHCSLLSLNIPHME